MPVPKRSQGPRQGRRGLPEPLIGVEHARNVLEHDVERREPAKPFNEVDPLNALIQCTDSATPCAKIAVPWLDLPFRRNIYGKP